MRFTPTGVNFLHGIGIRYSSSEFFPVSQEGVRGVLAIFAAISYEIRLISKNLLTVSKRTKSPKPSGIFW